jgi:hypothetical protein
LTTLTILGLSLSFIRSLTSFLNKLASSALTSDKFT